MSYNDVTYSFQRNFTKRLQGTYPASLRFRGKGRDYTVGASKLIGKGAWSSSKLVSNVKIFATPYSIVIALVVTLIAFLFTFYPKPISQQRLFSVEELALYNGTDESLPILLGILGSVFDVTKGKSHYGKGGGYNHFAGRDASRAFVSGNFSGDGLTDSLRGLSSTEVKSIVEWRDFYSRSYTFVGKLVGLYYDSQGNATKYLKGAEAKAARGAQLLEKQKNEEAKQPSCNSRWSQNEGGEVWCDVGYPRLVAHRNRLDREDEQEMCSL